MTPHKHAELIKAWADGAEIQLKIRNNNNAWISQYTPSWDTNAEYRIKPKTIKYRNFLWESESAGKPVISVTTYEDNQKEPRCDWRGFITWVGDWQEVEI